MQLVPLKLEVNNELRSWGPYSGQWPEQWPRCRQSFTRQETRVCAPVGTDRRQGYLQQAVGMPVVFWGMGLSAGEQPLNFYSSRA